MKKNKTTGMPRFLKRGGEIGAFVAVVMIASCTALASIPIVVENTSQINTEPSSSIISVPDDYPTIEAALNEASPGDIIIVRGGFYDSYPFTREKFFHATTNIPLYELGHYLPTVLVLVNESIYSQIEENLIVFEQDLNNEGYRVIITTVNDQDSPLDIRNLIKSYYAKNNLRGAILVGNIKAPYCEYHTGDYSNPEALKIWISVDATDMYYMDLDGEWEYVTNPDFCEDAPLNVVECHTYSSCETFRNEYLVYLDEEKEWDYSKIENKEQYKAEIWVSRIMAHNLNLRITLDQVGQNTDAVACRAKSTNIFSTKLSTGTPPDLTVFEPEIDGLNVTVHGVVLPGTPGETITRIHWDWGDENSEDHWFPASHTYAQYGEYTINVTAHQSDGLTATETKQISLGTSKNEVQIINDFFKWDHEYRTGNYTASDKVYLCDAINDPIIDHGMNYTNIFANIIKKAHISKDEYMTYLEDPEGSKLIYILAHSWPQGHCLYDETLTADELLYLKKNSVFYILNACSSCRWDQYVSFPDSPNYLGGLYVFAKTHSDGDYGLGAIGFTGVGGFGWLIYFTDYLSNNPNATYGEAYKYWFNNSLMHGFGPCNFVYLGDPTIGPHLINQYPIASFSYSPHYPIVNQMITFNASNSTDTDGYIANYEWSFGDGNITNITGEIITHAYSSAGNYTVNLTVTDDDGTTNSTFKQITVSELEGFIFDTGSPANPYPSIFGTHNGTIKPNQTITVQKLYTYPCSGTGGHTAYARIWNNSGLNATATWNGYKGDWHNISFPESFRLYANETYNYTIHTGSYPQIHHNKTLPTANGGINCTEFIDANGKKYTKWIPAIKLYSY